MGEALRIQLRGVTKSFGAKHVLRGIDLDVKRGESVVVIGGSGSGKSVLLKCILGLRPADGGQVLIDGADATHLKGRARAAHLARFGMLFQGGALFDSLPVWQNVTFAIEAPAKARRAMAIETLARVGLAAGVADLRPAELSGGMQKRVALARAIAARPEIILFDEPTTGLDPIMADVINRLIRDLVSEMGITAITITHDMASVRRIADSVAMLYEGRIIWHGPREALEKPDNPYVDQFVHGRAEGPIAMPLRKG